MVDLHLEFLLDPNIAAEMTEAEAQTKVLEFAQYLKAELLTTEVDAVTFEETVTNQTVDLAIEFKDVGMHRTPYVRLDNRALKLRGDPYLDIRDLQPKNESQYTNPVSARVVLRLDHEMMD